MKEEAQWMKQLLPSHYTCTALDKGVRCKSRQGIDENDPEQWDYTFKAIKQKFGPRFQEVFHATCYNHVDFTVYIKP